MTFTRLNLSRKVAATLVVALVGAAAAATTALAGTTPVSGTCDWMSRTLPTPFARWGDYGRYFGVPGGDFEGSLSGWTLRNGATPVYGNDSYRVGSHTTSDRCSFRRTAP